MWVETGEPLPEPPPPPLVWVETGVPVPEGELELEPLVPVETGALGLGAEAEDPLVPVVTGAAVAVELAAPLVPLVTGAGAGAGAGAAVAAGAGAGAGETDPATGLAFGAGRWRTLWIVRWTTWVRTLGWFASTAVAGGELFELSA